MAQQADLRAANDLKLAIQAAVARQVAFVKVNQGKRNKLASELATAQAKASALTAARQAALARPGRRGRRAGRGRGRERRPASPAGSSQVPSWAWGSGASATQGDVAANWALTQLGKPYQWGGAGPTPTTARA